jgi:hypothetical protein
MTGMTERDSWKTVLAGQVRPGDRVRTKAGEELTVTRIEPAFFGDPNRVAFIEDTPQRWYKRPVALDAEIDVAI